MHHQTVTSTSETGGSELEDEYCSPVDVCLACMPLETWSCCTCQGHRSSHSSKTHRQLWLHALILFLFAVALAGLAYYSMTLQNQLAVLSMHLDPGKNSPAFSLSLDQVFLDVICVSNQKRPYVLTGCPNKFGIKSEMFASGAFFFGKWLFKQLFSNFLNRLLHKTNCYKRPFSYLQITKKAQKAFF